MLHMQQNAGNISAPPMAPVPEPQTPVQMIDEMLHQARLAEALEFSLSQGDMECVMHVCREGDVDAFSEGTHHVSQPVLCSLLQQLSCDLEIELEIKMEWLQVQQECMNSSLCAPPDDCDCAQAALLMLDQNDAVTKAMLPTLLEDLSQQLEISFEHHSNRKDPSHNSIKLMRNLVASIKR